MDLKAAARARVKAVVFLLNKLRVSLAATQGLKIEVYSDIPTGCGLGSSAAFSVALSSALMQISGNFNLTVFEVANEVESIFHESPSGIDVYVSQYGGLVEFRKNLGGSSSSSPVREPKSKISRGPEQSQGDFLKHDSRTIFDGAAKNSSTRQHFLSETTTQQTDGGAGGEKHFQRFEKSFKKQDSVDLRSREKSGKTTTTQQTNFTVSSKDFLRSDIANSQMATNNSSNSSSNCVQFTHKKFKAEQILIENLRGGIEATIVNSNVSRSTKCIVNKVRKLHGENSEFVASCCLAITHLVQQFKHELLMLESKSSKAASVANAAAAAVPCGQK